MRSRIVLSLAALLALPCAAASQGRAPGPRVVVTPSAGYVTPSPVFEHDPDDDPPPNPAFPGDASLDFRDLTRAALDGAPVLGARVEARVGARWSVYADGGFGRTEFRYLRQNGRYRGDQLVSGTTISTDRKASVTRLGLGVSRRFPVGGGATEAVLGAGGAFTRLHIGQPDCPLPPPGGYGVSCDFFRGRVPWEDRYDLPGASASLALRHRLFGPVGVEARGDYSVGWANTEGFLADLNPEPDGFEALKRTAVHLGQLSAGVSIGF